MEPPEPSVEYPVEYVSASKLRQLFNDSQYPQLIEQNQIAIEKKRSHLLEESELKKKSLPAGTRTETIRYRDRKRELYVLIHQYLLPDGSLGASGKRDPKALLRNGIMFYWEGPETKP